MIWHFPHGVAQQSSIRVDGWKLIYNYMPQKPRLELYHLYENSLSSNKRIDIEEAINLADRFPEKSALLKKNLFEKLNKMNASYPYLNPHFKGALKNKERVCTVIANGFIEPSKSVWAQFKENGAKVVKGQIIYTLNGGEKSEEWYLNSAEIKKDRLIGKLPKGTTHYIFFNFVDENNFLISYPTYQTYWKLLNIKEKVNSQDMH